MKELTPAASPAEPEHFEILNPDFLLSPGSGHSRPPMRAVLAAVPGVGRIARWTTRSRFGEELHGYSRVDPDPARPPEMLLAPRDELGELFDRLEMGRASPRNRLIAMEKSPQEAEFEAIGRQWPYLAELLSLAKVRPARAFEIGPCWRPVTHDPRLQPIDWEHFRDAHAGGDFGEIGRLDMTPPDPASAWMIGLADQRARNAHSIRCGVGVVRSCYPAEGVSGATIQVATALCGGTFTILQVAVPNF